MCCLAVLAGEPLLASTCPGIQLVRSRLPQLVRHRWQGSGQAKHALIAVCVVWSQALQCIGASCHMHYAKQHSIANAC
jgi:hypothetical protein